MPRANRHYSSGLVWHLTHRCHDRHFLLKFARDRRRWCRWLFEARQRYGMRVLNWVATSNHVHVLVHDRGGGEIARGMQLAAGRTAQEFNTRKGRRGSFWDDRYHATAVATDAHLQRCIAYIDLNMVRAGVVTHPHQWSTGGFAELLRAPQRYATTDFEALRSLLGYRTMKSVEQARTNWVDVALQQALVRDPMWTEAVAVGSKAFVEQVHLELGDAAVGREPGEVAGETWTLREEPTVEQAQFWRRN